MRVWVCMCLFFLCCYFSCAVHIFLSFSLIQVCRFGCYQQEPADTIMYIGHAFAFVCVCVYMNRWWVRVGEIKRTLSIGPINNGIFSRSGWRMRLCVCVCVFFTVCQCLSNGVYMYVCRSFLSIWEHTTKQMNVVPCKLGSCTMHAFNADMIYYISVIQIYKR